MLNEDFETEAEGWQVDRVREQLRTDRYFHGVYYPKAFQIDGRKYVHGLATLARRAGARIFEDTPVVSIDSSGIRKRIVTPTARLRATHIVLAGNIHLGAPLRRLSDTLLPVWRYAGRHRAARRAAGPRSSSSGDRSAIPTASIISASSMATRLMWASPRPPGQCGRSIFAGAIARRIRTVFPRLGNFPRLGKGFGSGT